MNLRNISLYLIIPFSGYYITKIGLSPVYIILSFGIFISSLLILKVRAFRFDISSMLACILIFYFTFIQLLFKDPDLPTFINVIFSIFIFIVINAISYTASFESLIKASKYLVYFSIPLLIIEAGYRLTHPQTVISDTLVDRGADDLVFYAYKFNSIMYQDSNFVAMFILTIFFFWVYLNNYLEKKSYIISFILISLLLSTISRAVILTLPLFLIFYKYRRYFYKYRMILIFLGLPLLPIAYYRLSKLSAIDGSFSSKFYILEKTVHYFASTTWTNRLFGVGFGNSLKAIGIGAHNFFITNLVEGGLIGLILVIIFWSYLVLKSKYKVGVVMFPFLFAGLSFASLAIPYLYVIFALILELERRRYES